MLDPVASLIIIAYGVLIWLYFYILTGGRRK